MAVGLEVWICLPSLALEAGIRAPLGGVNALAGVASGTVPTQLALLAAAGPSERIAARSTFLASLPPLWPSTDVWLSLRKRAPGGTFQIFSLASSGPISCPSKVGRIFSRIFQKFCLFSPHCAAHSIKGVVGWFSEFYILLGLIVLYFGYIRCFVFRSVFPEVCGMKLGNFPGFVVGWCFLWCILFSSFQHWKIFVNLLIYPCLSWLPQKYLNGYIVYQTQGWDQMFLTNFQLATWGDVQFFIIIKMLQKLCMYCVHTSLMISLVNDHIFNNDKFNFTLPHSQHCLSSAVWWF